MTFKVGATEARIILVAFIFIRVVFTFILIRIQLPPLVSILWSSTQNPHPATAFAEAARTCQLVGEMAFLGTGMMAPLP